VPNQPQAFLSYTRVDDQFFGGAITSLRRLLELGVQVVTGDRSFQIFQDIDGIEFGQQWKTQLDKAIWQVKFLIPILTPCFFSSGACRDELGKFIEKERKICRNDLILPVYFVTTPLLEKSDLLKDDHLALEISRRQRYDWRSQADLPITDTQVRQAVRELAEKISEAIARTELTEFIGHPTLEVNRLRDRELKKASERIFTEKNTPHVDIKQKLILWVDDRPENNIFERKAMDKYGIKFVLAQSTNEAVDEIEKLYKSSKSYFDAIISDMGRPTDSQAGYTLLESLRARGNQTPYFIYGRSRAPKHIAEALARGAQGMTNVPGELIEMVLASLKAVPMAGPQQR
jgi:CheY-like chemotaxis protein